MSARRNLTPLKEGDRVRGYTTDRRGVVILADEPWLKHGEVVVRWADSGLVEQEFDHNLARTHRAPTRRKRRRPAR